MFRSWTNCSRSFLIAALALSSLAARDSLHAQRAPAAPPVPKTSSFGKYSGYSEAVYDGLVRSSRYITVRDGTRLAIDLFRPSRGGKVTDEKLPVVWTHNRYRRAWMEDGKLITIVDVFPWLQDVLRHGYVVAAVDSRGGGASFGSFQGMFTLQETQDSYDVTEWLAAQPWSNGKIGMYGRSYLGITQYLAAGQEPPHLTAIFPEVAVADLYALLYHGGIFHGPFIEFWNDLVHKIDLDDPAAPVDEDPKGELRAAALAGHRANRDVGKLYGSLPYRDSVDPVTGAMPYREASPITYLRQIRKSKVAVYHLAGWFDRYVRDQLVLFRNLDNPQRITIGPWTHTQQQALDFAAEHLRWWDYWLKGIDNGIMREEPVHYYLMGAPEERAWRSAPTWPPPGTRQTAFYLAAGRSGTVHSTNDGSLLRERAEGTPGRDELTVDYSAAVTPDPRWSIERNFPELSVHDAKGLTYTTPPLPAAVEVVGHPVVHLQITSSAPDADLFVYLEEVDEKGASQYVSEGALRASNRAVADPGYDFLGLPYHRGSQADRAPLIPGQAVELSFDLFPTANLFEAGHRIRLTVTGADKTNARTPEQSPPPRLTLEHGGEHGSWVELPLLTAQ
jgi:putative CocE/NonD family hydrolase